MFNHIVVQFHTYTIFDDIIAFALYHILIENRFGPTDFVWIGTAEYQRLWNATVDER